MGRIKEIGRRPARNRKRNPDVYKRQNWDDVDVAAPTTETLEIPDFGFTAFADEVYDRIPLSVSGGSAADFLYSSHVAFPPMNGIAPYRPCRYPLAMFSPFRGEKSVKA